MNAALDVIMKKKNYYFHAVLEQLQKMVSDSMEIAKLVNLVD